MAYLVLARKWRPTGFDAITGQEHVTRTLRNAIAQDRVHHAFLFCGARGVGKTSAARVLAKALNCRAGDGPTAAACGTCSACKEIAAGTSVDVFEIDGASNRGIGEIRELRDGVAYAPQRDRFKIYIIDEVHMLTTEAFNALLKTLEEPPPHVKFIFATTEPHKIPVTILSRCQRFDFKRIPMPVMVQRLGEILEAEGVRIDDGGLRLVARESEGSMRDALSLLDRVISACGSEASVEAVASVLGVADRAWLNRLVLAALQREPKEGLKVIAEVFEFGVDLRKFTSDLVHHLRDLAMIQVAGEDAPTELSTDERRVMVEIGARFSPEDVQRLVRMAAETAERLVQASFPRLELEMLVIRMGRLHPVQPLDVLLSRLVELERRLGAEVPLRAGEGSSGPKGEAQAKVLGPTAVSPAPDLAWPSRAPGPAAPPSPGTAAPVAAASSPPVEAARPAAPPPARPEPLPAAAQDTPPSPAPPEVRAETPGVDGARNPTERPPEAPAPPPPAPPPPPSPPQAFQPPQKVVAPTLDEVAASLAVVSHDAPDDAIWEQVVEALRADTPSFAGALDHVAVGGFDAGHLTLDVAGEITERRLAARHDELSAIVRAALPAVERVTLRRTAEVPGSPHQRRQERDLALRERLTAEVVSHPLVVELQKRFGGVLGEVSLATHKDRSGP
jgi:DNA polymerase-3 subunit gamma/tau